MIINHPVRKCSTPDGWGQSARVVQCDTCQILARDCGTDSGDAAEKAYRLGFETRKPSDPREPRSWVCTGCAKKEPPKVWVRKIK